MSRAFVKEDQGEAGESLPERPISPNPNYVTPRGLALIEAELMALRAALAKAQGEHDRGAIARISRDLRYWLQRRTSAIPVPLPADHGKAAIGHHVTLARDDGREQAFTIVGEDEADPKTGRIAWTAPLARAVLGQAVGDEVTLPGGVAAEITAIAPDLTSS